jgi:hypothetical protein
MNLKSGKGQERSVAQVYLILLCLSTFALEVQAQQLAFPGAEGGGKYTRGGRGGKVLEVTRLDDDANSGTLRWAVNQTLLPYREQQHWPAVWSRKESRCQVSLDFSRTIPILSTHPQISNFEIRICYAKSVQCPRPGSCHTCEQCAPARHLSSDIRYIAPCLGCLPLPTERGEFCPDTKNGVNEITEAQISRGLYS